MKLQITTDAYQGIVTKIGSGVPEKGGILMGKDGIITDFIFDKNAHTTGSTYSLNVAYLNPLIKELKQQGKQLLGIIHSHPYGCFELSNPDKEYFMSQFKNFPDLDFMYTPIVFSAKQDEFQFFPYVFYKNGTVKNAELEILPNDYKQYTQQTQQPDPNTVLERKKLLVVIRQKTESSSEREQSFPLLLFFGMLFFSLYCFILGMCFATFLFFIRTLLKL